MGQRTTVNTEAASCAQCGTITPPGELTSRRGYKCRTCISAYHREWRRKNKASHRASVDRYRASAKGQTTNRNGYLVRMYGITLAEYERMLADQSNRCAICTVEIGGDNPACVDHCHGTGSVRGLLCRPCNASLGAFRDSVELLLSAVDYLNSRGGGRV